VLSTTCFFLTCWVKARPDPSCPDPGSGVELPRSKIAIANLPPGLSIGLVYQLTRRWRLPVPLPLLIAGSLPSPCNRVSAARRRQP